MPKTRKVLLLCILSSVFQSFLGKTREVVDKRQGKKVVGNEMPSVLWSDRTKGARVVSGCIKHDFMVSRQRERKFLSSFRDIFHISVMV